MSSHPELRIKWEWEPSGKVRAKEHAATWARIEIWVGSECVTLVEDRESGSSRRSIYCPLYPLAEWIAYNWWFIQSDARPARGLAFRWSADQPQASTLMRRHSIRGSGDGFLWPNLLIIPEGSQTRLVWQRDRSTSTDRVINYLNEGDVLADPTAVLQELASVVSEVLTRLAEEDVHDTPLHKEWAAIQQAHPDEVEFCHAAARLGLDPYSEAEPYQNSILDAAGLFSGDLLNDFLDAVAPQSMAAAIAWIQSAGELIRGSRGRDTRVRELRRELRRDLSPRATLPWEVGWTHARRVRSALEMTTTTPFDLEDYVSGVERISADRGLLAAGGPVEEQGPVIVTGQSQSASARKFTLARALWHHLWGERDTLFLVTTAYTDRQKVERAFAAELLAPAAGISEVLETDPKIATVEDLERVAAAFEVSPLVVRHQLQNQLLSDVA
ncbi:ImmA/IrrE family metallo-endopeptidase [Actinomadura sp. GC306]|uniref:ImmA/IrrE family metallo-endopeptidase n=1 Tax=Actinomadura sp. GC306 TaxID=2530367 RepID=UPI0010466C1E|nr:ImmA/IrrE family metallo-endopeptidase [Actinomadura sp. GC306]TDC64897.1 ImmA/IrrE family metallo-endopeptidase [Actinomadura sp. GC306]